MQCVHEDNWFCYKRQSVLSNTTVQSDFPLEPLTPQYVQNVFSNYLDVLFNFLHKALAVSVILTAWNMGLIVGPGIGGKSQFEN